MTHTPQLDQTPRPALHGPGGAAATTPAAAPGFLWLEITGKCQLACEHCYAGSSPAGTHGTMTPADWRDAITAAASAETSMVQFIGGEPTLHPDLPSLASHALACGLNVEVYSNLVHVPDRLWEVFTQPGVSLATSWYTDDPAQHRQITGRNTWARTWASITEAHARGIPLRAGIIAGIIPGQRHTQAAAMLAALGIAHGTDHNRPLGRGTLPDPAALCGACGDGIACVGPDGEVHPCPMSRWVSAGNIRGGLPLPATVAEAATAAGLPRRSPSACAPNICLPNCTPSTHNCKPHKVQGHAHG
ncbi:MAG TPA: radical SAM/SPASM domain-containing protein [Streptosporangiaceae bacterium]|jgi:MoaA/NifB/PqqE/SkfB family radical SAM enzyme